MNVVCRTYDEVTRSQERSYGDTIQLWELFSTENALKIFLFCFRNNKSIDNKPHDI